MGASAAAAAGGTEAAGRAGADLRTASDTAARSLRTFSTTIDRRTPTAPAATNHRPRGAFVNMMRFPIAMSTACTAQHCQGIGTSKNSDSDHSTRDARLKKPSPPRICKSCADDARHNVFGSVRAVSRASKGRADPLGPGESSSREQHRDQCGHKRNNDGGGESEDAVLVLPIPQIHAPAPRVQANRTIGARERHCDAERRVAALGVLDQPPVLQVTERQLQLRGQQLGPDLVRDDRRIETLRHILLAPRLAVAQRMHCQPKHLLTAERNLLVDVLTMEVQAMQDPIFVVSIHLTWAPLHMATSVPGIAGSLELRELVYIGIGERISSEG